MYGQPFSVPRATTANEIRLTDLSRTSPLHQTEILRRLLVHGRLESVPLASFVDGLRLRLHLTVRLHTESRHWNEILGFLLVHGRLVLTPPGSYVDGPRLRLRLRLHLTIRLHAASRHRNRMAHLVHVGRRVVMPRQGPAGHRAKQPTLKHVSKQHSRAWMKTHRLQIPVNFLDQCLAVVHAALRRLLGLVLIQPPLHIAAIGSVADAVAQGFRYGQGIRLRHRSHRHVEVD